jgi:hypothetical protein
VFVQCLYLDDSLDGIEIMFLSQPVAQVMKEEVVCFGFEFVGGVFGTLASTLLALNGNKPLPLHPARIVSAVFRAGL